MSDRAPTTEELIECLLDVVTQACWTTDEAWVPDDDHPLGGEVSVSQVLDSMALTAYADGLRMLATFGKVRITAEHGRRVVAELVTE